MLQPANSSREQGHRGYTHAHEAAVYGASSLILEAIAVASISEGGSENYTMGALAAMGGLVLAKVCYEEIQTHLGRRNHDV